MLIEAARSEICIYPWRLAGTGSMPSAQTVQLVVSLGPARDYLRESRRPLASLALVLPLVLLYEGGLVLLGRQAVRNGADVWLRQILDLLGFGQYLLLPILAIGLLLAWHHVNRERWQLSAGVLYGMVAECALWALALLLAGQAQAEVSRLVNAHLPAGQPTSVALGIFSSSAAAAWGRVLGFIGAGVYEEMLFRLLLVPPLMLVAARLGARHGLSVALAVAATSFLFSAAHYLGPRGEALTAFSFSFRVLAGVFFGLVFVYRGFGIAAGSHALYDIFVGLG
jgi:hypothetical protein